MANQLEYTKELMERFRNPKFVKKLKNPNAVGEVGNIRCGDIMRLELEIKDNKIKENKLNKTGEKNASKKK